MHTVYWHITGQERTHREMINITPGYMTTRDVREIIAQRHSGDHTDWPCVKIDAIYDPNGEITGLPSAPETTTEVADHDRHYWTDRAWATDDTE